MSQYQPPFTFTNANAIVASVARISERLAAWTARSATLNHVLIYRHARRHPRVLVSGVLSGIHSSLCFKRTWIPTFAGMTIRANQYMNYYTMLSPKLRSGNRIQTIQASLAIEHNTLSVEQALNIVLQENDMVSDMVSGGVNIKLVDWGDIDLSFIRREMICLGRIISGELTNTDKKGVAA